MRKGFIVLLVLSIGPSIIIAQNHIQGKVITENNEPIVGATIVIKGSTKGTVSDEFGSFSINEIESNTLTLTISSLGFQSIDFPVVMSESSNGLIINLSERTINLPDILIESVTMTGGLANLHKNIGSAHYIGQKEMQKFSYSDINRTLRNIPGVNIQEEDGYGLRPNIGLRASGSERSSKITVMEDGILAAPAPYAAPSAYYFPTIARMTAVEILKGSSQIKYGPFTTGGAINLISTPIPLELSGQANIIAGSDGYKMNHVNIGNSYQNVGFVVETLHYGADGFKELDNKGNTGFNKRDYLAKLKINTNPNAKIYQSLQFKIGHSYETSHETYLGLTSEDFETSPFRRYASSANDLMTTTQHQYALTHHISATSFLDIVTNFYKNDFSRNWYKLDKVNGTGISTILNSPNEYSNELSIIKGNIDGENALSLKANNRSYYGKGVQTNLIFHFANRNISHKIEAGLRIHEDQIDRFQWVDSYDMESGIMNINKVGLEGTESNRIETANATAAYLQYKIKWDNLTLTPGLRYENISIKRNDFGKEDPERTGNNISNRSNATDIWIPGFGVNYNWSESISSFGGIHKGFAPPGSKEGSQPEESWNYELGLRLKEGHYKFQTLFYYNDYSNLLGSDLAASGGQGSTDLFNGGKSKAFGLELEASVDLLRQRDRKINLPLSVVYTHTQATFDSDFESDFEAWGDVKKGYSLPYTPRHQFAVSLSLEHSKFQIDLSTKYNGEMLGEAGSFSSTTANKTSAYLTTDVSLNYKLTRVISAFANVNNVTNEIYVASLRPAGLRPGLPRTFNLGLKLKW